MSFDFYQSYYYLILEQLEKIILRRGMENLTGKFYRFYEGFFRLNLLRLCLYVQ